MIITENEKKRIIYLSKHRGSKELDIALGNFIDEYIEKLNDDQISHYEDIINCDECSLLSYILNPLYAPDDLNKEILQLLHTSIKK